MSAAEKLNRYGDERDYPFDPELPLANMHLYKGLDRLRFVEDAGLRAGLYELFFTACRNDKDPKVQADIRRQEDALRQQKQRVLFRRAMAGELGAKEQQLAQQLTAVDRNTGKRPTEDQALELFATAWKELRHGPDVPGERNGFG